MADMPKLVYFFRKSTKRHNSLAEKTTTIRTRGKRKKKREIELTLAKWLRSSRQKGEVFINLPFTRQIIDPKLTIEYTITPPLSTPKGPVFNYSSQDHISEWGHPWNIFFLLVPTLLLFLFCLLLSISFAITFFLQFLIQHLQKFCPQACSIMYWSSLV